MMRMKDSRVVAGFVSIVTAAIPAGGLSGAQFMEWKNPLCEPGAEQNKRACSRAFGADGDFAIGKRRKSLPEIATVGTQQGDIYAREQWRLRIPLGDYSVRGKLMLPVGHCWLGAGLGGA
jgi:hypothetical protein